MSERLLTAREVAEFLGVTAETVLRWTRAGELRGYRMPGSVKGRLRYRPDEIEAWIAEHSTADSTTPRSVQQPVAAESALSEPISVQQPRRSRPATTEEVL